MTLLVDLIEYYQNNASDNIIFVVLHIPIMVILILLMKRLFNYSLKAFVYGLLIYCLVPIFERNLQIGVVWFDNNNDFWIFMTYIHLFVIFTIVFLMMKFISEVLIGN